MEMEYDFDLLMGYLENRDYRSLRAALAEENEVDIADFIERLPQEKATLAFRTLPKELAAEVFSNLPPETQQVIVGSITDKSSPPSWRTSSWTTRSTCSRSCPPAL